MKFYPGQPIVCVKEREWFMLGVSADVAVGKTTPIKGVKYRASRYVDNKFKLVLHNFAPAWFHEDGFVPVTEDLVKQIIAKSQPVNI